MKKFLITLKEKICGLLGWLSIIGGILYGIWLCFYQMFYGGIIQIITGIQNGGNELAFAVAAGICKILFCELGLIIPIVIGAIIGCVLLDHTY